MARWRRDNVDVSYETTGDDATNMEQNENQLVGIPRGLYALLCSRGEDNCREAVWTQRQPKRKFFLDIWWPRKEPFIFPPEKSCEQVHSKKIDQDGHTPPGYPSCNATLKDSAKDIAGAKNLAGKQVIHSPIIWQTSGFQHWKEEEVTLHQEKEPYEIGMMAGKEED